MTRPRIEGERRVEILETTLRLLAEVGYDRLHVDAVARRARVSKATIYRHWQGKSRLVLDSLSHALAGRPSPFDTDSLRTDLLATLGSPSGLGDPVLRFAISGMLSAMILDSGLGVAVCREVLAGTRSELRGAFDRARARGEVRANVDVELLATLLVAFVMHGIDPAADAASPSECLLGFVDRVILPAARQSHPGHGAASGQVEGPLCRR